MLRWFPRFQVATTCFLCSPPDLNLVVINFIFCIHVKQPLPPGNNSIAVNNNNNNNNNNKDVFPLLPASCDFVCYLTSPYLFPSFSCSIVFYLPTPWSLTAAFFPLHSLSLPGSSYPHNVTTAHQHTIVAPLDGAVDILRIYLFCVEIEL